MAKAPLGPGDSITTTLGVNMPLSGKGGNIGPWVKAEVTNITVIRPKESYQNAVKRSNRDAKKRLDTNLNWLVDQITGRKEA